MLWLQAQAFNTFKVTCGQDEGQKLEYWLCLDSPNIPRSMDDGEEGKRVLFTVLYRIFESRIEETFFWEVVADLKVGSPRISFPHRCERRVPIGGKSGRY